MHLTFQCAKSAEITNSVKYELFIDAGNLKFRQLNVLFRSDLDKILHWTIFISEYCMEFIFLWQKQKTLDKTECLILSGKLNLLESVENIEYKYDLIHNNETPKICCITF